MRTSGKIQVVSWGTGLGSQPNLSSSVSCPDRDFIREAAPLLEWSMRAPAILSNAGASFVATCRATVQHRCDCTPRPRGDRPHWIAPRIEARARRGPPWSRLGFPARGGTSAPGLRVPARVMLACCKRASNSPACCALTSALIRRKTMQSPYAFSIAVIRSISYGVLPDSFRTPQPFHATRAR